MIGSTGSSIAANGDRKKQDRAVGLARQAVGLGTHRAPELGNLERYGEMLSGAFITLIGIVFGLWPVLYRRAPWEFPTVRAENSNTGRDLAAGPRER
jgi:hypothetical protein